MFSRIVCSLVSVLVFAGFCVSDSFGTADCPTTLTIITWEPFATWNLSDYPYVALMGKVQAETSDYTVTRYRDGTAGGSYNDCTRANFDAVASESGITYVAAHGNDYPQIVPVTHEDKTSLTAWVNGQNGLFVGDDPVTFSGTSVYCVYALSSYFTAKWHDNHDTNKSIVFLWACEANGLGSSMGGKTFFGFLDEPGVPETVVDIQNIFGRMNGTLPTGAEGTKRVASLAFQDYEDDRQTTITLTGGDSTLAPAPIVTDSVYPPDNSSVADSGTGYIIFDTVMDTNVAATSALTYDVYGGDVTITDRRWVGNDTLEFKWSGCGAWSVGMTAERASCKAPGSAITLDGNRIAPNEEYNDSVYWSFCSHEWGR